MNGAANILMNDSPRTACTECLRGLRIAFLAGSLGAGGSERQLYYWLRALVAQGAEPLVIDAGYRDHWHAPMRALGVPVLRPPRARTRPGRLLSYLRILQSFRPRIVHSLSLHMNAHAAVAARIIGAVELGALRSRLAPKFSRLGRRVALLNLRLPRLLVVNSAAAAADAIAHGCRPETVLLLDNVVDTERFRPLPHAAPASALRLVSISRAVAEKRLDRFIDLLAALGGNGTSCIAGVIIGASDDPAHRLQLERRARALHLGPDRLRFTAPVADPESLLRASDVLVHTADSESAANALLEAMACGLPIVTTGVAAAGVGIVHGENGFVIEPYRTAAAAEQVRAIVATPAMARAVAQHARAHVVARHRLELLPESLARVYRRALAASKTASTQGHGDGND